MNFYYVALFFPVWVYPDSDDFRFYMFWFFFFFGDMDGIADHDVLFRGLVTEENFQVVVATTVLGQQELQSRVSPERPVGFGLRSGELQLGGEAVRVVIPCPPKCMGLRIVYTIHRKHENQTFTFPGFKNSFRFWPIKKPGWCLGRLVAGDGNGKQGE